TMDWASLPQGLIEVSAVAQGVKLLTFTPHTFSNNVNRSVDARENPNHSLFTMNANQAYLLDIELMPLVLGEPATISDRWGGDFGVTLRIVPTPEGSPNVWKLAPRELRLSLCSSSESASFECINVAGQVATFKPTQKSLPDVQRMLAAALHGESFRFELQIEVDLPNSIKGPPLTAALPVRRVRSNELPLPFSPMFCAFEDPEYSRRLSSPTKRETKAVMKIGSTSTVPVTIALDRQEYNPSTTLFFTVDTPKESWNNQTIAAVSLSINRVDTNGIREAIFSDQAIAAQNLSTIFDVRFGTSDETHETSLRSRKIVVPGDKLEFIARTRSHPLSDPQHPISGLGVEDIKVTVQIVRDPVTPPPEAGYALLRRRVESVATTYAKLGGGVVTGFELKNLGQAYDPANPPIVTIEPPGSQGVTATAHINPSKIHAVTGALAVDAIVLDNGGSGYTEAPRVTIGIPTRLPVECVRFAWGPTANRIEFVDPGDLLRDTVRRRAVFSWQGTVRRHGLAFYGIQKIAPTGATQIPTLHSK
ncbi:MAG: hypothetical protein WCK15_24285, partial [Pirellula sp.]